MAKLPLPDEQPTAVNALRNMRAKIAGKIAMHTREIDRLRAELIHLDSTLRLFDPETDPNDIPVVRLYPKRTEWFARGEVTRRLYEAFRNEGIIWPNEVARRAIAENGIPETDSKVVQDIISIFAHVAAYLTRRGKLVKIGKGRDARWKVAPTEPDLL